MKKTTLSFKLRKADPKDAPALYLYKNDASILSLLGGFHSGLSQSDVQTWIENHRSRDDEALWIIADAKDDSCLGHVGFYKIDHRIRSAEFAILVGDHGRWGKGVGKQVTSVVVEYGFMQLNLNRISLTVLENNERAIRLYKSMGFTHEGILRQAQFKDGRYLDLHCYSLLREEF